LRYLKTPAEHRPLVNVSITSVKLGSAISDVALVVGAATPFPKRLRAATDLVGHAPSLSLILSVADAASKEIDALSDNRATADYRRELVRVLVARALSQHFHLSSI
jgi:carbon-monoxide dehydrogenase medium subunit